MQRKRRFILFLMMVVLSFLLPLVVFAQNSGSQDSAETMQEQALAWAAEQGGITSLLPVSGSTFLGEEYPLLVGVDDANTPAYQIAPLTNISITAFSGAQVWGAAYDQVNNLVYFNSGATLYEWPVGGTINPLGTIVDPAGATQSMVGLAFYNGQLYGTKNIANEAIWAIDPTTLIATVYIDYADADLDCGGFAADPNNGTFYCTNDDATPYGAGLLIINQDASVTPVAPYPAGQTDIDGLAVSDDGFAYLVIDEPGFIYVYDFAAGAYTAPLTNPWTTAEVFSAGAWIWDLVDPPPVIEVNPAELSQVQVTNSQVTRTLTISNTGDSDLEWTIGEAGLPASLLSPAGGGAVYYTDRSLFDTAFPGLPVEDFEAGLWADGAILGCPAPFDALTNNACFASGGILPGVTFQDNPLNEAGGGSVDGLVGIGAGAYGAISKNIVSNTFVDSFEIIFDPPVRTAGMDLTHYVSDEITVDIALFDASDNPIGTTTAMAGNAGMFWGVYSATPIGRINIFSPSASGDGAEGVDNVAFGQIGNCDPPVDLPWVSVNPITGTVAGGTAVDVDVIFDSTGLAAGVYTGTLCINNNDPLRPLVEVPLTMTVITYGVDLSGNRAAAGEVGTTVTYTIQLTNTGSVTDTFGLTATGGAWATTISSSSVALAASQTVSLTVQVEVPGDAEGGDSNMTTVTAVSQTDPGQSDSLLLTTTAVTTQQFIYLPVIIKP